MQINIFDNKKAAEQAGKALDKLLAEHKNLPILLVLSGGSALEILDEIKADVLSKNLTITMLDERFTPLEKNQDTKQSGNILKTTASQITPKKRSDSLTGFSLDKTVNNFSLLRQTKFYKTAAMKKCGFIGTSIRPDETKEAFADRWEKRLRGWRQEHPKGKIIATFGMGADGHTAGIFPLADNEVLFKKLFLGDNWLTAYSAGGKNQFPERITTTLTFFKLIDAAVAYISGQEKQAALKELKNKSKSLEALPAMALWKIKNTEVFTDIK